MGNSAARPPATPPITAATVNPPIAARFQCQPMPFLRRRVSLPQIKPAIWPSAKPPFAWHVLKFSPSHISQHQAGAAGAADSVAQMVGLRPRLGADAHLIEGARASAAKQSTEQHGFLIADHTTQPR